MVTEAVAEVEGASEGVVEVQPVQELAKPEVLLALRDPITLPQATEAQFRSDTPNLF